MQIQGRSSWLSIDSFVNVAILLTCGAVLWAMFLRTPSIEAGPLALGPGFKSGETAEAFESVNYALAPRTLLVYVKSTCAFCTQSLPFYAKLSEDGAASGTALVGVSSEPTDVTRKYLESSGVRVTSVVSQTKGGPAGTPTLVLVDRAGKVVDAWVGRQDAAGEAKVVAAVKGTAAFGN